MKFIEAIFDEDTFWSIVIVSTVIVTAGYVIWLSHRGGGVI